MSQDSDQIFGECRDLLAAHHLEELLERVKASPYYSISVDEKDRFMLLVLSFFDVKEGKRVTTRVVYKDLAGFEAAGIFRQIRNVGAPQTLPGGIHC